MNIRQFVFIFILVCIADTAIAQTSTQDSAGGNTTECTWRCEGVTTAHGNSVPECDGNLVLSDGCKSCNTDAIVKKVVRAEKYDPGGGGGCSITRNKN